MCAFYRNAACEDSQNLEVLSSETKRQCLKCNNLLPVPKDASTSHLINHLKSKGHEEQFKEYESNASYKAELSHYRHNSNRPERNDDVFIWWSKSKARFQLIAKGAKILLCVPATSVNSERTFSIAGLLYSNTLRNRMHGTTAEMLILIKANLNKVKLAPSIVPDEEETKEDESDVEDSEIADRVLR